MSDPIWSLWFVEMGWWWVDRVGIQPGMATYLGGAE